MAKILYSSAEVQEINKILKRPKIHNIRKENPGFSRGLNAKIRGETFDVVSNYVTGKRKK